MRGVGERGGAKRKIERGGKKKEYGANEESYSTVGMNITIQRRESAA